MKMKMKRFFGEPNQAHVNVELLSAFLDGQVSQAERGLVEAHLSGCAVCREELESLRRTVALVQALPRVRVPRAFTLSEAMVGRRHGAAGMSWLGGLARGLGAVAAVALVVVLASTLLRQPMAVPMPQMARSAPTAAPAEKAGVPAMVAPAALPETAAEAQEAPVIVAATEPAQATTEAPAAAAVATDAEQPQPAARMAAPTEAVPVVPTVAPVATPEPSPALAAAAASTETPVAPARTLTLGEGGLGAAAAPKAPPPSLPMRAVTDVLPATARLVYADLQALWALDRAEGVRQIAEGQALSTPIISPDGDYVAYRSFQRGGVALWGVSWREGAPRLLLDEAQLPREGLAPGYTERRIQDIGWVPGSRQLVLILAAVPAPAAVELAQKTELWMLDVETGAVRFVADMGRAFWPYYAPDGKQFALLEYGTEADPSGRLTLFDADGSDPRVALTFPASPAKLSYETQLAWLADGSALWLAIPTADPLLPGSPNGTTVYLVLASGQAQEVAYLEAREVAWSPDGTQLAYLRMTDDEADTGELRLAEADGSNDQLYAAVQGAAFLGWSPGGTYFLYQDSGQVYLGAMGRMPLSLAAADSLFDLRWVSETQFVGLYDTGEGWLLTLYGSDGTAYGLLPLPRDAMLDVLYR